ncbi:DedA family protein [Streptomyces sp. H10-C2]|uniref:DedA family protein n=1 Tax=unclassified Streptomyces TaxID=2593676 RepID=UPI0024BBA4C1|nr:MULTISPECIES: DedA family protein [unclassified Streptomyces]MDJ0346499.1 DedA family protein [Streptomyces sp. PH10-H1]MDJ0374967.1 DedA family protein [Streptomyces sp. H10-C2]
MVVVLAAIAGDSVGYEVGHRFGPRILTTRPLRKHQAHIASAQGLIRRRGPAAVFLGRFIAFFRAMMPALAGTSHMPYRRFLPFNALGGLAWGIGFTLLGYFAGSAYATIEAKVGRYVAIALAAVVIIALIVWHLRRRRRADSPPADAQGADTAEESDGPTPGS